MIVVAERREIVSSFPHLWPQVSDLGTHKVEDHLMNALRNLLFILFLIECEMEHLHVRERLNNLDFLTSPSKTTTAYPAQPQMKISLGARVLGV